MSDVIDADTTDQQIQAPATLPSFADGWSDRLAAEFAQPYMQTLRNFLRQRKSQKVVIYPHSSDWFRTLQLTAFDDVRVVILGQDPYHGPGQAHGLSFSVPQGMPVPPSLVNIYKELHADLGLAIPTHGFLEQWASQGVVLLNSVLTVEKGAANSHQGRGWETFTDAVIDQLNRGHEHLVFMLWGSYAQKKGQIIDTRRHCVLKAPHPSPLSAHRGFLGCKHFSKANDYLQTHKGVTIDWSLG